MSAEGERIAFLDDDAAVCEIGAEEILHHRERGQRRDDLRLRIGRGELRDVGRVIGLHMMDDQEIDLRIADLGLQVLQPLVAEVLIDRIHYGNLLVFDHIGIVSHPERDFELPLKEINFMIVDTDVLDIVRDLHLIQLLSVCIPRTETT